VLQQVNRGEIDVLTDGRASPTGYPFKIVQIETSNSSQKQYLARKRVCDLGYLRTAYRREDGRLDYRCAAEPVDTYVKKGGAAEDTVGRKCLCNALMADIGMAQVREPAASWSGRSSRAATTWPAGAVPPRPHQL
jgi:NAD(P)H-dependent flavin oxidoreductase YrpB (nitropropane dioxygenase family)